VTLLEILRIYAEAFVEIADNMRVSAYSLSTTDIWADDEHRKVLEIRLRELKAICGSSELPVTETLIDHILTTFSAVDGVLLCDEDKEIYKRNSTSDVLKYHLHTLIKRFRDELSTKLFLQIPHSRKGRFDNPLLGWDQIIKRFPDCVRDVEEMNKCFALSRYTASMFHAMHVAEWGAIDLGNHIGVVDPKLGWGPTTKRLRALVNDGRATLPATLRVSFDFVEQMNQAADTMKLAWRNKIDHAANTLAIIPNVDFTPDIAEHIIQSVKVFLERIAEGTK
jgi:hypothetical protein